MQSDLSGSAVAPAVVGVIDACLRQQSCPTHFRTRLSSKQLQKCLVLGNELMTSFLPKAGAIWPGLPFRGNGHGLTLQEADDQGAIYLQAAVVVADEAFLPEPIH